AIRTLPPSPHTRGLEIRAKQELAEHLQSTDPLKVGIVGYITAAKDGLAIPDLMALTNASQPQIQGRITNALGRILASETVRLGPYTPARQIYLLGHETLHSIAEEELAHDLDRYRQRIHQWADEYCLRDWPADTPDYLLRPYAALLTAIGNTDRL